MFFSTLKGTYCIFSIYSWNKLPMHMIVQVESLCTFQSWNFCRKYRCWQIKHLQHKTLFCCLLLSVWWVSTRTTFSSCGRGRTTLTDRFLSWAAPDIFCSSTIARQWSRMQSCNLTFTFGMTYRNALLLVIAMIFIWKGYWFFLPYT